MSKPLNRVLHVITTIELGGAEKQLLILAREQVALGAEVHIAYLKGNPDLRLSFEAQGIRVYRLNGGLFSQLIGLRRICKISRIDLMHTHLPRAELVGGLSFINLPMILTRHNTEQFFPGVPSFLSRLISNFVCMRASAIVAISDAVRNFLINTREVPLSKDIHVIKYGADKSLQSFQSSQTIAESGLRILSIGRLVSQKDYPTALKALVKLKDLGISFSYTIVGLGPLKKELTELSILLGISEKISWIGKTHYIEEYLRNSDVFILPSRYEGFGLVLLESMAQDIPILAANCPAVEEVLGENFPGLFPLSDFNCLAQLLQRIPNLSFQNELRELARKRLSLFDPVAMAKEVDQLYREVILKIS
jgi:glycosyltransferase involved in cell wall biosynthesis